MIFTSYVNVCILPAQPYTDKREGEYKFEETFYLHYKFLSLLLWTLPIHFHSFKAVSMIMNVCILNSNPETDLMLENVLRLYKTGNLDNIVNQKQTKASVEVLKCKYRL